MRATAALIAAIVLFAIAVLATFSIGPLPAIAVILALGAWSRLRPAEDPA